MRIISISTGFIEVPGQISVNVFVQGCKLRCNGCHTPELQPFDSLDKKYDGANFSDICGVIRSHRMAKWVCWLGGDATYQPDDLIALNQLLKFDGKFICLYTGREFDDVSNELLLANVDLVKCGPWEGKVVSDPDTNQKFYLRGDDGQFIEIGYKNLESAIKDYVEGKPYAI
jgi:anaerobic ribonucleoside-triphosphate reductase activating protein